MFVASVSLAFEASHLPFGLAIIFDLECPFFKMENSRDCERKTLVNELIQGRELVKQLRVHLNSSSHETAEFLVEKIISSYEKALHILKRGGSVGEPQPTGGHTGMSESPRSLSDSPRSEDSDPDSKDQDHKDASKKRKTAPRWIKHVRVCSETGIEGPLDDGYNWRKYGQKDILGAKYPRGYFRCSHRNVQGCLATKQVQRSDEDPWIFEITYRGKHTCTQASHLIQASASSEKQEPKQNKDYNHQQQQTERQTQEILMNFRTGLTVKTELLDIPEQTCPSFSFPPSTSTGFLKAENHIFSPSTLNNNFMGSFSPPFISPTTSESNYYSDRMNIYGGDHNSQPPEYDLTEIISAATSTTSTPIVNFDFTPDPAEFNPSFPFDTPGFFP
ncbi:hypothetical protein HHK36_029114 [Tetracentron sinense]|uniref:WRKY domain-containing protein n=1 Tax=Tetracentron sinense TaxID=13715 RepID=A0A834YG88_TETSI|nr:hypothetical protein HHK36_029114 [Tetracentron sinense]